MKECHSKKEKIIGKRNEKQQKNCKTVNKLRENFSVILISDYVFMES